MKSVVAILVGLLLGNNAVAQNYLRDDGIFHSVVEGTTTGQCLVNLSGLLAGAACVTPAGPSGAVQFNNSGALGGDAGLTYVPGGALSIAPTALSNNRGLVVTQSTPNSGSVVGPICLNCITVTDGTQTITGGFPVDQYGQITNQTDGLRVNTKVTGGSANHFGINSALVVTATNGGSVGLLGTVYANSPGNTITGDLWGIIGVGQVGPTTNLNQSLIGIEAEMLVADTGLVKDRVGIGINSQGPTTGSNVDAAIVASLFNLGITNFLSAAPFKDFIWLNKDFYGANAFPIATTGSIIRADTGTVANFLSAHTLTITGNIIDTPNVLLSGLGVLRLTNVVSAGALAVTASAIVDASHPAAFNVDTVNGSGNGVYVFSTAAGSGANITTVSSNAAEILKINAKGTATVDIGGTSTGGLTVHNSFTATGLVTLADLATQAADTAVVNATGGAASPTAVAIGSCSAASSALTYNTSTHAFGCNSISGTVSSIATTSPITGGTITTTGTIGCATCVTSAASLTSNALMIGGGLQASSTATTGTGVLTALGVNTGTAGAFVVNGGALGSPSSAGTMPAFTLGGTIAGGGNQINNTIIGTSTPLAGTFTTLNATTSLGIVNTSQKTSLDVNANSSSSPALIVATSTARFQAPDAATGGAEFVSYGAGAVGGIIIAGGAAAGTSASPTATIMSQFMYNMRGYGYNSGWQLGGIWIMRSSEAWSAGHQGTAHDWYTTPNASTTIQLSMTLQASGGLSLGVSTDPGAAGIIATGATIRFTALANVATTSALCYNTGTGLLTYDGTVGTCTVSDERLKNMGERIPDALERLLQINGVYYTWKDPSMGSGRQIGVGAQTVEAVFPELVQTDSGGRKSADYQRLTAPIIEAMRELKSDIEVLKRGKQ